jgi:AraC family transcriptional regulator of adaptative response/methylated-DNA-[protein]-cysteine methyltransferase
MLDDTKEGVIAALHAVHVNPVPAPSEHPVIEWAHALARYVDGLAPWPSLPYDVAASPFQKRVWEYLRSLRSGQTMTYAEVAVALGEANSARAVARACASNPIALAIPCHRVLPKKGGTGGYRWHPRRKALLIALEQAA